MYIIIQKPETFDLYTVVNNVLIDFIKSPW